jgi:hypothetical protein
LKGQKNYILFITAQHICRGCKGFYYATTYVI